MAGFQEQLQAILGDPEAMGQISNLARALAGGGEPVSPSGAPPEETESGGFVPVESAPPAEGPDRIFSSLAGAGLPDVDPRLVSAALKVYGEYSAGDDEKTALLNALKPFLREERREKIEKAVQIARFSRVIRVVLQLLKEEEGERV